MMELGGQAVYLKPSEIHLGVREIIIIGGIIFFVWVQGEPVDWKFAGPIWIGIVIASIVGEVLLLLHRKNREA